jgi:hypothetical protein
VRSRRLRYSALGAAILGVCAAGNGVADDATDLRAALASCHAVAKTKDRLACYERLAEQSPMTSAPQTAVARTAPGVPAAPAAQPPQSATEDFGLSPVQQAANTPAKPARPKSLQAKVAGFSAGPTGRSRVLLDNGQLWEIQDSPDRLLAAGDTVTIERATLGSFLLVTSAKVSHRVQRIH